MCIQPTLTERATIPRRGLKERGILATESKEYLDFKAILTLIALTLLWGLNYPAIKYSNQGISPVFTSALRSFIASIFGVLFGILFLNEEFTISLMVRLPMVSVGIFFVNWKKKNSL